MFLKSGGGLYSNANYDTQGLKLEPLDLELKQWSMVSGYDAGFSSGPGFKTSEWFQGQLSLHSFKVDEMSTRYSWGPKSKKQNVFS